jgi:hypothetical protein
MPNLLAFAWYLPYSLLNIVEYLLEIIKGTTCLKVLNCACSSPSIDDCIKYKLCEPTKVTSFSIMASILQLIHNHFKRHKPLKYLIFFV